MKFRSISLLVFLCFIKVNLFAQPPMPCCGKVVSIENFVSKFVSSRNIDVWLPEGYDTNKKYSVLYMQDGQMLFDGTITWNKQEWGVDETMSKLMFQQKIRNCIVVGIWNGGARRHAEYFPQKPFESLSVKEQELVYSAYRNNGNSIFSGNKICSDDYLKFMVTELKPYIDKNFSTNLDRSHTFIAGSSMGALISLYAICEYPNVFGGAACLSTHWPGLFSMNNNPVPASFFLYLNEHLPTPSEHRLYFDYGTETLDSMYASLQIRVDGILKQRGYNESQWMTKSWPGQDHSERSWRSRFDVPILFLFKP